jgi:LPXTG-motif cell wall-anchored protein
VTLPEHVTLARTSSGCTYSADNRVATCTSEGAVLPPRRPPDIDAITLAWAVTVAADAPGPAARQGGRITVEALDAGPPDIPQLRSALPDYMRWVSLDELPDVDPTDNENAFAVFVAGQLPVTGARTGLYALSGVGLLVLGALIVVLARRDAEYVVRHLVATPARRLTPAR